MKESLLNKGGEIMNSGDWAVIIIIIVVGLNILWVDIDEYRELRRIRNMIREFDKHKRR